MEARELDYFFFPPAAASAAFFSSAGNEAMLVNRVIQVIRDEAETERNSPFFCFSRMMAAASSLDF